MSRRQVRKRHHLVAPRPEGVDVAAFTAAEWWNREAAPVVNVDEARFAVVVPRPDGVHLVLQFSDARERVHPWPAGPAIADAELLSWMREPDALVIALAASVDIHAAEFLLCETADELQARELALMRSLQDVRTKLAHLRSIRSDGRWWLRTDHDAVLNSDSTQSARRIRSRTAPDGSPTALRYCTVQGALAQPVHSYDLLSPGLYVLRSSSWSQTFSTASLRLPRERWDVVTDCARLHADCEREFPHARCTLWDGVCSTWPAAFDSRVLLLIFTRDRSYVGYLGALDRATHILVSELCASGSHCLAVDQVCSYWRQLCEAEAQADEARPRGRRRQHENGDDDDHSRMHVPAETIALAARAASEFYSGAAMQPGWTPSAPDDQVEL